MARKPCTHYILYRRVSERNADGIRVWGKWEVYREVDPKFYQRIKSIWREDSASSYFQYQWRKVRH